MASPNMPAPQQAWQETPLQGMNDPRLRLRLLRTVMLTCLSEGKSDMTSTPVTAPHLLSGAVETIQRHQLLFEPNAQPAANDNRRAVLDLWSNKVTDMLESTVVENRWAGACLLGLTCKDASKSRFLSTYAKWAEKLAMLMRPPEAPLVKAAACSAMGDLLLRLGSLVDVAGIRREGSVVVGKVLLRLLETLGDPRATCVWIEGLELLRATLLTFPGNLRSKVDELESWLVARIMDPATDKVLRSKCATCLALLPGATGDANSWSLLMRRILIAINSELDVAFAGIEDLATAGMAMAALLPRGQDAPYPLGGPVVAAEGAALAADTFWQQLRPRVGALLHSVDLLLTQPYSVPVPVPTSSLLALAVRILKVDGGRPVQNVGSLGTISVSQQVSLCAELPALHSLAVRLLHSTLKAARSLLLPRAAEVARLLSDCLRRNAFAGPPGGAFRRQLYDVSAHFLCAMGAGVALSLAPSLVAHALSDLRGSGGSLGTPKGAIRSPHWVGSPQQGGSKKRKEPGGLPGESPAEESGLQRSPEVQVGALNALEVLLSVGGSLLPDRWRSEVDTAVAAVAMSLGSEESGVQIESAGSMDSPLKLAAYKALLASVLSPRSHRPPYLPQALNLFRRGRMESGTDLAKFCSHAALACEPLLHPRALPAPGSTTVVTASAPPGSSRPEQLTIPPFTAGPSGTTPKGGVPGLDPWEEVDTWLGYGDDLLEANDLLLNLEGITENGFVGLETNGTEARPLEENNPTPRSRLSQQTGGDHPSSKRTNMGPPPPQRPRMGGQQKQPPQQKQAPLLKSPLPQKGPPEQKVPPQKAPLQHPPQRAPLQHPQQKAPLQQMAPQETPPVVEKPPEGQALATEPQRQVPPQEQQVQKLPEGEKWDKEMGTSSEQRGQEGQPAASPQGQAGPAKDVTLPFTNKQDVAPASGSRKEPPLKGFKVPPPPPGGLGYDSDSGGSLPDIVDGDPDEVDLE